MVSIPTPTKPSDLWGRGLGCPSATATHQNAYRRMYLPLVSLRRGGPSFGQPPQSHVMLITGYASHGRTDRPSPHPKGRGLGKGQLRPRCIPRPRKAFVPSCGTSRPGRCPGPAKEPSCSLGTHDQGASPLEPDAGLSRPGPLAEAIAPLHPRPELSRSGHEQGPSSPCTLTRGGHSPSTPSGAPAPQKGGSP